MWRATATSPLPATALADLILYALRHVALEGRAGEVLALRVGLTGRLCIVFAFSHVTLQRRPCELPAVRADRLGLAGCERLGRPDQESRGCGDQANRERDRESLHGSPP